MTFKEKKYCEEKFQLFQHNIKGFSSFKRKTIILRHLSIFISVHSMYKGPVYLFAIGEYIKPDTPKNLTWRIIAKTSCMPSCARINN